nr:MAG TPA: holin [Caudoviricetes sp.]
MLYNIMLNVAKSDYVAILFGLILFDFLTGFLKAWKWQVSDSWTGLKGVIKHTLTFIFYYFVAVFLTYVNAMPLGQVLLVIINLYYVLSILENLAVMGVYIPKFMAARVQSELQKYTAQLDSGKELMEAFKGAKNNEKE